jgi:SpoU rRNA methylase family enzyme/very-short-patch-repair endonuclease
MPETTDATQENQTQDVEPQEEDPIDVQPPAESGLFSGKMPINVALNELRLRLLDLTGRNRLINFKHSPGKSLQFVHGTIDGTFKRLTDQARVAVAPVPEPDKSDWVRKAGRMARPDVKEFASSCGISTSYNLGSRAGAAQGAGNAPLNPIELQTLFYAEDLGKHCRKLEREAKLAIEETGANMLYLVTGFLEFPDAPDSDKLLMAPLLCLPVVITRVDEGQYSSFFLQYTTEEVSDNLSLREKLKRDFGVNLPEYDSESEGSAEEYLKEVARAVENNPNWRVHRMMTLTLLSFTNMLLVRDLDPEKWTREGEFDSLLEHPLVKQVFEGKPSSGEPQYAEEYAIDEHPKLDLPLIYDADSSQHSALIDVLEGHNRVIEGPPGTGKSQTITNLIAVALQAGKKVLFVAEKLAALEVVKTRLSQVGLDPFILELHSNKANKKRVLEDIANRINLVLPRAHGLPELLSRQEQKRVELKAYADLMNTQVGSVLQLTLYQVMWRSERHRLQAGNSAGAVQALDYFAAGKTSPVQFAAICDQLRYLATQFELIESYGQKHALWGFFPRELSAEQDLAVQRVLQAYADKFGQFSEATQSAATLLGGSNLNMSAKGSQSLLAVLANIAPANANEVDFALLPALFTEQDPVGKESLALLKDIEARIVQLTNAEALVDKHLLESGPPGTPLLEQARQLVIQLQGFGMQEMSRAALEAAAATLKHSSAGAVTSIERLKPVCEVAQLRFEGNSADIQAIGAVVSAASSLAPELLDFRHEGLRLPGAVAKLAEAKTDLDRINALLAQADGLLYLDTAPPLQEISQAVQTLREGDTWYRVFQGRWRKAKGLHRRLEKDKGKKTGAQRLQDLELLVNLHNLREKWAQDPGLRAVAGAHFQGEQTALEQLGAVAAWAQASRLELERADVRATVFDPLLTERSVVVRLAQHQNEVAQDLTALAQFDAACKTCLSGASAEVTTTLQLPNLPTRVNQVQGAIDVAQRASEFCAQHLRAPTSAKAGLDAMQLSQTLPVLGHELETHKAGVTRLGAKFKGRRTALETAFAAHTCGTLIKKVNLPKSLEDALISQECVRNHALLTGYTTAINQGWQFAIDFAKEMAPYGRFEPAQWADPEKQSTSQYAQHLAQKTGAAANSLGGLLAWSQYVGAREKALAHGLDGFVTRLELGEVQGDELVHAFTYRFYATIAKGVFDRTPDLKQFSGSRHSALRRDYADVDRQVIKLRGAQVALACNGHSRPPAGNHGVRVGDKTEMKLLEHLIPQPRPRVPVRQIMHRAGIAIQQLKPCFMMGPQAVAQFLAPGALHFDIIVMDEASQLRPEQAIGAIARGSQLVVVGDPKQLPPTSFFSRVAVDGDGDSDGMGQLATSDAQSILDVCISHFQPVRTLRWHYRSRHESLIAFSNQHFYRGNLVVFPSPFPMSKSLGLRYQYVADGVYENQMNQVEAKRVVDAAVEHILQRPNDSMGIVSLNIKQRDLIDELLDERLRNLPQAKEYKEKWDAVGMGLFVKNLENVQGDERDCIYISTTFGKAAGMNVVRQNFGPISREGGWRRLNVLFTRARKSVAVFSSMRPEDIVSDSRTPEGTRALRDYLEFARTGIQNTSRETGLPPDSDFEVAVIDVLKGHGYEVTPQLGVAKFRIDIAVKHPHHLSGYLAAIECDGASYHSGVSVRDRDRIRQEILESLGWKDRIWRIWSTDWFRNPIAETERMVQFLENLSAQPLADEYVAAQEDEALALQAQESPDISFLQMESGELEPSIAETPVAMDLFAPELHPGSNEQQALPSQESAAQLVFDEEEEDLEIEVGDLVTYAPLGSPNEELSIRLTAKQTNPEIGLVAYSTPLGAILMGATVGEQVVLRVPSMPTQSFVIKSINRPAP